MTNRIASFFLCVCLLLTVALPAAATQEPEPEQTQLTISNTEDFLKFAEMCRLDIYSENLLVLLEADLNLTGTNFAGIPIFRGTFEGGGHTIRGLNLTGDGSAQGLFRYVTDCAVVQNLTVEGNVQPGGSRSEIGGLAGNNGGKLVNCTFIGVVSGNDYIGGLVGVNAVSGILENCRVEGSVHGSHFVGGIAGKNSGVIRASENKAGINAIARQNTVGLSDITLESLTGAESVNTVTDIGGIAGTSCGVIRECINRADVGYQHMGYNIGGIAGTQSGYLVDCENYGQIQGRKEVGGIAGQMEPVALIEYEEDALQILQKQLSAMGSTVSKTASNVQNTGDALYGQVGALQGHVQDAADAVELLLPDWQDPSLPDEDTIHAARNNLSSSLSGMHETLYGMRATTESAIGTLSNNLYTLQNQVSAMSATLGNVSQTLGGSITDVSDRDTEQNLTGKVERCVNRGDILADRNAGGIVGAMAMENDLDHEDDWKLTGENSLNFESELRAVVLACENQAEVTAKKQNAGGIVGWQSMGLVKNSSNTGKLTGENAEYVGGISGQSRGFLRNCYAKCEIQGEKRVGGIAGSATIVTDCRSMVKLVGGEEKLGAILGDREDSSTEEENPVAGNLYVSVLKDSGGIDGISYSGLAEPVSREDFLALENLPGFFQTVTVRFCYGNGAERCFSLNLGDPFPTQWIPPIPPKAGYAAVWKGLTEEDLSCVLFDLSFDAEYSSHYSVIQSNANRNGLPILLIQGDFTDQAKVTLTESQADVPTERGEKLLEVWDFSISDAKNETTARFRLPEEVDPKQVRLLVCGSDGAWREVTYSVDGSYLVFQPDSADSTMALLQKAEHPWQPVAAGAVVLVLLLTCLLWYKTKHRKTK